MLAFLREQHEATGSNYCVGQFAFGDLTLAETLRSIELFAREVMPELQQHGFRGRGLILAVRPYNPPQYASDAVRAGRNVLMLRTPKWI